MATKNVSSPLASKTTTGFKVKSVLVRMYNVGFGDAFLIEFPNKGFGVKRVLIDCGSIAIASMRMPDVVGLILADTEDDDGTSRIDIVVCTHRHADHVSGFADPRWAKLKVSEVWFPWTEDPNNKKAKHIRETQSKLALALRNHWQARITAQDSKDVARKWLAVALNALSNQNAMKLLHQGFESKPIKRYLSSDGSPVVVNSTLLPGVVTYVLGPSTEEDVIRDMNPPAGTTYLRQVAKDGHKVETFEPFHENWAAQATDYEESHRITDRDKEKLHAAASQWDPAITVALEQAVNGTSLVLAFEIDDVVLLFPGDAQWGTWHAMLKNEQTAELLSRTRFWKVGHHGSHNATPVEFVAGRVPRNCCAMMSTKAGKWKSIPRSQLLTAIQQNGIALARSDESLNEPAKALFSKTESVTEIRIDLGVVA